MSSRFDQCKHWSMPLFLPTAKMQASPVSGTIKAGRTLAERSAFIILLMTGTAKMQAKVLGNHHIDFSTFHICQKALKTFAFKIQAGSSIIHVNVEYLIIYVLHSSQERSSVASQCLYSLPDYRRFLKGGNKYQPDMFVP